jgi:NAD(P)-dependent dehydrogenase (short-subunit alcohol dehydrogenase family)
MPGTCSTVLISASAPTSPRAVLVTGASSGIGAAISSALVAQGFLALGAYRDPADCIGLRAAGIIPIQLDVVDAASLAAARALVEDVLGDSPLWGLVNNAGVSALGAVEAMPLDALRALIEVNVIGVAATCQAFLPLIRNARGRVVNIGSLAGERPLPFLGAYSASKAALDALSESLRHELEPAGVKVIVIQPGAVRTGMAAALRGGESAGLSARAPAQPPDPLLAVGLANVRRALVADAARGLPPEAIAAAVLRALTVDDPPARIRVARWTWRSGLARALPTRWRDRRLAAWVWRTADDGARKGGATDG